MKSNSLRWKKYPAPTGLSAVGAGSYRGSELHDGTKEYASVNPVGGNWREPEFKGWYWVAFGDGMEYNNTCNRPLYATEKEAKDSAKAYVLSFLNKE